MSAAYDAVAVAWSEALAYARHSRTDAAEHLGAAWEGVVQGRTARYAVIDAVRQASPLTRVQMRRVRTGDQVRVPLESVCLSTPSHEALCLARVDLGRLLDVLTAPERQVVVRCELQDEPARSVARDLGVTESRVSQIRSRALQRMREAIHQPPTRRAA